MANTVIDPATLIGGKTSKWQKLAQATIEFTRVLSETIDPATGNSKPENTESLTISAYFETAKLISEEGHGVPVGSYKVAGYTVGILPEWAKIPNANSLPCIVQGLGRGQFCFQGKIHVVKDKVEKIGKGSQIQGYFTIQGSR
jgi:hypothetical protein